MKLLLIAPVLIAVGMLTASIGVGLYDFRIGMIVGGILLGVSGFIVAPVMTRLQEAKNADSGSIPSRATR